VAWGALGPNGLNRAESASSTQRFWDASKAAVPLVK
jgi:hypothetical protein